MDEFEREMLSRTGGFSAVKVILSDVLPTAAFSLLDEDHQTAGEADGKDKKRDG